MMRRCRSVWAGAAAALAAIVMAGCANTVNPANTDGRRVTLTSAGDDMVIEVSTGGGLAPSAVRVSDSLPRIWIAGDGRYIRQTSDGSANPALPTLEERQIPEADLPGLLDEARTAGLLDDGTDYGRPLITDAMVTRVVIVSGGTRHQVLVYALGYPNPGLDDAAMAARARLSQFLDALQHPERMAGVSAPTPYVPTQLAVFVLGAAGASAPNTPAAWPLGDLANAGTPTDWPVGATRCLVLAGADVNTVLDAAAGKDRSTPWRAGDGLWSIAFRPLLPDEHSCADIVR